MAIKIYGQIECASGDRLTNAEEIRDDNMQATLGTSTSPTQAEINEYLAGKAGNAASMVGVLDVTTTTADALGELVPDNGMTQMYLCGNADGEITGGTALVESTLGKLIHSTDTSMAVNLGDILIATRTDDGTLVAKVLPVNDAKAHTDGFPGTYGTLCPNDKAKLDQAVSDIDQTCFRCYSGEYNMNYCGWYGYYMYGTLGRPAGSSDGEYYVLRVANGGTETDSDGNSWVILEQTAYSAQDASRVFRRIVKTRDRSAMDTDGYTTWGNWVQMGTADDIKAVAQKVSDMLDGAPEAYDTLKEIADYLATHQDEYAALVELVNKKEATLFVASTGSLTEGTATDNTDTYLQLHQGDDLKPPILKIVGEGYTEVSAAKPTTDKMQVVTIKTEIAEATTEAAGLMSAADKEKLDSTPQISILTQAEYDALEAKDANTVYYIKG